jgi:hypothetical protein
MTTRITTTGPGTEVVLTGSASRVTPPPVRLFSQVMNASATAVVDGAEAAVRSLPGGPLLAAAVRPGSPAAAAPGLATQRAEGAIGTAGLPGEASPTGDMEAVLANHADQNLHYLQLQERISAENRAYSTLSNVLKARHDTIKNAIGNIR